MRTCSVCNKKMHEGFLHEVTGRTYCGEACLHEEISAEEYSELYDADICFWTNWEEEDVC